MGSSGLPRREAKMTQLHPQLGETRRQELRNASFWPSSLFKSQLVKEGVFQPYQNEPFRGPHKKRGSYRKHPCGGNSSQAVTNRFLKQENKTSEAPGVVFNPTTGEGGVETPLPNDSSKASISPPVGGRLRSFRRD